MEILFAVWLGIGIGYATCLLSLKYILSSDGAPRGLDPYVIDWLGIELIEEDSATRHGTSRDQEVR